MNVKTYTMLRPNGDVVTFTNLTKFAKDNNVCHRGLRNVLSNVIKAHKGWQAYETPSDDLLKRVLNA